MYTYCGVRTISTILITRPVHLSGHDSHETKCILVSSYYYFTHAVGRWELFKLRGPLTLSASIEWRLRMRSVTPSPFVRAVSTASATAAWIVSVSVKDFKLRITYGFLNK